MNIPQVKKFQRYNYKIILLMIAFVFVSLSASYSKQNTKDRLIKIACLPHKTYSQKSNKVKILNAIEFRSKDNDFGGLSGLLITDDMAKAIIISDRAQVLVSDIVFDEDKNNKSVSCLKNTLIRVLRGRSTNPLTGHYADSEGISFDTDRKKILVSFERYHRVVTYTPAQDKLIPGIEYEGLNTKNLPFNESYESVLVLPDKSIIAYPERHEIENEVLTGFRLMPDKKVKEKLRLRRHGGFWLTDLDQLSNGDFITLERSFTIFSGMGLQMRHIKKQDFLSGNIADGEVIFKMRSGDGVDNFEGLEVVPQKDGSYRFYILSDNNFSPLQKTLLLSLSYKPQPQ